MMQPKKYKAKDLKGEWVIGWYVEIHLTETDAHDKVTGYKTVPSIFNDEPGNRNNGGYWHQSSQARCKKSTSQSN